MSAYEPGPGDLPPRFDRYDVQRRLGKGGMGAVYLALDGRLDRLVAIKVPFLRGGDDAFILQRFQQEAVILARLNHTHLCTVFDAAEWQGFHYLTMRFIDGASLRQKRGDYQGRAAVALVAKLAHALIVVHEAGVVHRDLKPENVIIDRRGEPVIVDFGLALQRNSEFDTRVSQVGSVQGTVAYMSPEQHAGDTAAIGPACDIYSLGVMLYELLTGKLPFTGGFSEMLDRKRNEQYEPLSKFGIDAGLAELCAGALRSRISQRYASMSEFAGRLKRYLEDEEAPVPAPATPTTTEAAASTLHAADPKAAEEVLALLRTWGWEMGLERLEAHLQTVPDARRRGVLQMFAGWIKGQRGAYAAGLEHFRAAEQIPGLAAWALVGQAFIHYRNGELDLAWATFDRADADAGADNALRGAIEHGRGAIRYRQNRDDDALEYLYRAADLFGRGTFGLGRVLDTLGMIYAVKNNFSTAFALYQKCLSLKQEHNDLLGLALTHGQLGRLLLDWGDLAGAEKQFQLNKDLCGDINDCRGEAQMYDHLGQVLLARGDAAKALVYLNEAIARNQAGSWGVVNEAYALKDRARVYLALGRSTDAEADARAAEKLAVDHPEVVCHASRALALALAAHGKFGDAEARLKSAAAFFKHQKEPAEAARTFLELSRVQASRPDGHAALVESLRAALEQADQSRRDALIEEIERALTKADREELYKRAYRRARGAGVPEDLGSLTAVRGEKATILFLDLKNFTGFSLLNDPHLVQRTLNQIFADMTAVVERHNIIISQYLGDGFMAVVRDADHAARAVAGALEMQAVVAAFNRPRRLLEGEHLLEARIGVATGDVVLGNIGTYRKLDFTAVGPTTNLAARLQTECRPGSVCIGEETWQRVKDLFTLDDHAGRIADLKGIGTMRVWDVLRARSGAASTIAQR